MHSLTSMDTRRTISSGDTARNTRSLTAPVSFMASHTFSSSSSRRERKKKIRVNRKPFLAGARKAHGRAQGRTFFFKEHCCISYWGSS